MTVSWNMTLWMKVRHDKYKKECFSHVLEDNGDNLMWLQSWRSSLSTEHQLFMDFHHSCPHLELGKMCTLPGSCAQCVGSYLTPKFFFAAELFAPSVAQKFWGKASSVQKGLPFWIFTPTGFYQVAEERPMYICKSEWALSELNTFSSLLTFSPHLDLLSCAAMPQL